MSCYDCDLIIDFVECLLSKGFVVKLQEESEQIGVLSTFFKKGRDRVFAKGRKCIPKPEVNNDGWEVEPLEFQDWWVDIIVDGLMTKISVCRYDAEEHVVWDTHEGFRKQKHLIPPSSITRCKERQTNLSLKELAIISLRDTVGLNGISDIEFMLDTETLKTAKSSVEWWVS
jgi:hypothetical protein